MAKLYEFRPHIRSFIDKISGVVPTNTSVVFRRLEKGHSAHFSNTADLDGFGVVTGVKSIVMVLKSTADTKLLQDDGTDRIEINGGDIVGTGLTECTVNTIDTDAVSNNMWSLVIAEFSGGIDFSTDLEIDVTADIDIVSIVCYDSILSNLEKGDLWYDFNHLYTTSTPTVIRHKIPVDPTGSVLTHDYQRWNGGIVSDLSGNGNDGTPNGFVDCGMDGARFPGIVGNYLDCGTGGGVTGNLTIEALVRKNSVVGSGGIINKGWSGATSINYYFGFNLDELRYIISDGVGSQDISTTTLNMIANEWYYVVLVIDGSYLTSYANGLEVLQTAQTITPTSNAENIYIGGLTPLLFALDGQIKFVKVSPYAITETQVKNNWNSIARLVGLHQLDQNLLPDGRVYTAGQYLSENVRVESGSFANFEQEKIDTSNLFDPGKGTFEVDTESWTVYGTNIISRDTINPHSGSGCLKIEYVDHSRGAYLYLMNADDLSTNLIVGNWYNLKCWARVNTGSVDVYLNAQGNPDQSQVVTSINWEFVSLVFQAGNATSCHLRMNGMAAGEIIWLDDVTIQEIQPLPVGDKWVENTANNSIVSLPQNEAYGTFEWEAFVEGSDYTCVDFISSSPTGANFKLADGYSIIVDESTGIVILRRNSVGSNSDLCTSAAGLIQLKKWYKYKITRELNGNFSFYIDNMLVVAASGANPMIDTTHTISKYFVQHLYTTIGARIRNFKWSYGVEQ